MSRAMCIDCGVVARMHASEYCRACKHQQRKAYWKNRDDGRDYPDQVIEAKYREARLEKRPWERARLATLAVVLVAAIGCAGPVAPSAPPASVDSRMVAVVAALESTETPLPWNGLTFRAWRARLNVPIRVEPMADLYGAVWNGSAIVFNANLTGYDTAGMAGLLAHELRHADGIAHDCGPHQDKRETPWSAYAVQVWTLEQLGEHKQADDNRGGFCD